VIWLTWWLWLLYPAGGCLMFAYREWQFQRIYGVAGRLRVFNRLDGVILACYLGMWPLEICFWLRRL